MKLQLFILLAICGYDFAQSSSDLVLVIDHSEDVVNPIKLHVPNFIKKLSHISNYSFLLFDQTADQKIEVFTSSDNASFAAEIGITDALNFERIFNDRNCNGASLTGIKRGLESIHSNESVIIVFTDASPSDKNELADIKKKIRQTHSKVIFVLIESKCSHFKSQEYKEIEHVSNGYIIRVKEISPTLLDSIQLLIAPHRVDLEATEVEPKPAQNTTFKIPISQNYNDVLITISANDKFLLKVADPKHKTIDCGSKLSDLIAICKIMNVTSGNYSIDIGNISSTYTLRASATSNLTFHYGFETFEDKASSDEKEIFSQPVKGTTNTSATNTNTFIVKFDNPMALKPELSIIISSANGTENGKKFTLKPAQNNMVESDKAYGVYSANLTIPNSEFRLKITGTTNDDKEFQLIIPVTLHQNSGKDKNDFITKEISYFTRDQLEPRNNSAKFNCSLTMIALISIFVTVKAAIYD